MFDAISTLLLLLLLLLPLSPYTIGVFFSVVVNRHCNTIANNII
jgi:hypothetical protein